MLTAHQLVSSLRRLVRFGSRFDGTFVFLSEAHASEVHALCVAEAEGTGDKLVALCLTVSFSIKKIIFGSASLELKYPDTD